MRNYFPAGVMQKFHLLILVFFILSCRTNTIEIVPENEVPPLDPNIPTSRPVRTPTPPLPTLSATCAKEDETDSLNLIAFVGPDDNIYTICPDGSNQQLVSLPTSSATAMLRSPLSFNNQITHNWPTWSPDASKLAYTSYAADSKGEGSLWVVEIPGGLPKKLFQDPPDTAGRFVAHRSPHYIYWSPDSERLAFLAPSGKSLVLYLSEFGNTKPPETIGHGAPSYFAWSPDGTYLLHHLEGTLNLMETSGQVINTQQWTSPTSFRAPSWSSDSDKIAHVNETNGQNTLTITNLKENNNYEVSKVNDLAVFVWSPSEDKIAFTQASTDPSLGSPTYDGLAVFDNKTRRILPITIEEISAFFWSPDGSKLAYVVIDRSTSSISWYINNSNGSAERKLADFIPTWEQLFVMFAFFDQYNYSSKLWSPDSTSLVYAGRHPNPNESGTDSVIVALVDGESPPRVIASGNLAFWSPK